MDKLNRTWLAAVGLALALPSVGLSGPPGDVPDDRPVSVKNDAFFAPARLSAANGIIDSGSSWGHSGPWVADVDGDGAQDLVVGDFSGLFRFYRNMGTNTKPRYARRVNLKAGGVDAKVPIY